MNALNKYSNDTYFLSVYHLSYNCPVYKGSGSNILHIEAQEKQFHKRYAKGDREKERECKIGMISVMHTRLVSYLQ